MSVKLPNGKISLTLPEQVGKNAKDIEDIKKLIDGLDSLDNVVVVPDISHVMTAEELNSVKQPVCFIVYNDHLYIKRNEQSGSAYFEIVFSIVETNVISFQSSQITVNLSNGALGIINSTVTTYSNAKVDELLALKASLSGADFTGDITAKKIEAREANYSLDIPFTYVTAAGLVYTSIFNKIKVINNVMHVVVNFKIKNTSNADISIFFICNAGFQIPESLAKQIYDINGHTINDEVSEITNVATFPVLRNPLVDAAPSQVQFLNGSITNGVVANLMGVTIATGNGVTVPANSEIMLSGRIALTLI